MNLDSQIDAILPLVSKPTRYLGNEFHAQRKEERPGMVRWCLVLPEVYEIGMSHLGLRILYHILNARSDALAERAYAPWLDMEARMRRHSLPLFSLESRRPLGGFDIVGFSLQYELTYTNLLNCLDLAGIPLRSEDRREGDPLVIAGGPCASNPEPMAEFIDLFLIGDGEEAVGRITEVYHSMRGRPRPEILLELARQPGLYAPQFYRASYAPDGRFASLLPTAAGVAERVQRQFIPDLESAPFPEKPLVPLQEIVQNRLSLEVLRGCTQGCRFCQAGYLYRPVRERSIGSLLELADKGIRQSGWDELGLVSLSTADYTQLESLADVLNARFAPDKVALSLPSLRADSFGVGVAERIRETRKTGFTFAPEAGSERLRLAMNKNIKDEEFFAAAHAAYSRGWRLIKMYFMIGLPTEREEDIEGIVRFVETVRGIGRKYGPSCAVHASVGAFVPKSHTPFQWDPFGPIPVLRERLSYLQHQVPSRWSRLKWHPLTTSHLEAVLSLGDRRVGPVIETAFRRGARFDGWTEHFRYDLWMQAMEECGVDPESPSRGRSLQDPLPWDHIDIGVLKKWLVRERAKTDLPEDSGSAALTGDCRQGDCTACGIPGLPRDTRLTPSLEQEELVKLKERAGALAPAPPKGAVSWPTRLRFEKKDRARFLSHLEMGQIFSRAFRMSRVPLAYSQGHHPHPKLAFGPPLSVGMEGWNEGLDAELLRPWSPALGESLNAVLPEGIRILGGLPLAAVPGEKKISLSAACRRAVYWADLSDLEPATVAGCRRMVAGFAEMESCLVERSYWMPSGSAEISDWEAPAVVGAAQPAAGAAGSPAPLAPAESGESAPPGPDAAAPRRAPAKGEEPRMVDLRQAVVGLEFLPLGPTGKGGGKGDGEEQPAQALLRLDMRLDHPQGHTANPRVLLQQLLRLSPEEQARVRLARTALLDEQGSPVLPSA